jgi:hypothetical protein
LLKLDLIPAEFKVAEINRKVLLGSIPLLVGVLALWVLLFFAVKGTIARTEKELAETTVVADKVRGLEQETADKKGELDPIQGKVDFVKDADASGEPFWDRFHKINQYIYDRVLMTNFSITPPSAVSFTVEIQNTEDAGRFLVNLMQCPHVSGIQIEGGARPLQGIYWLHRLCRCLIHPARSARPFHPRRATHPRRSTRPHSRRATWTHPRRATRWGGRHWRGSARPGGHIFLCHGFIGTTKRRQHKQ